MIGTPELPSRDRIARLLEVMRQLATAHDIETVTAVVRTAARELTRADGVTFVLRDAGQCYYADEDAIAPLWKGLRFPLSACISGWVMLRGEAAVVPDIYADSRIPHDVYRPTFVRSLAMVPVRPPEAIAAIGAYWAAPHHASDEELQLLGSLADAASLALANVELFGDLRAALDREQAARVRAEASAAAKDHFLAMVAHELKQPLHAARAAVGILRTGGSHDSADRAREVVERQIVQMSRLVDDLLDVSRIVRGQIALHRQSVNLEEVLTDAVETVVALRDRRHQVQFTSADAPVVVQADPMRLQQVFINVLSNAAKYTPAGGRIAIVVQRDPTLVRVHVRDNGQGIAAQDLPHIFELFTRAAMGDGGGFGIGLAVARSLLQQHGGSIEAFSAGPGRGSEFVVTLPRPTADRSD